jgi:hypothetical protein
MAADVMSLMEGVTLDTDFETSNEMPPALFASKRAQWDENDEPYFALEIFDTLNQKQLDHLFVYGKEKAKAKFDAAVQKWKANKDDAQYFVLLLASDGKIVLDTGGMNGTIRDFGFDIKAKKAQDSAYTDEPSRPMDDVLQDALAMVKSMKRSDPATIKNTIKAVYGLSDKDASDLVSYGKRAEKEDKENDGEYEVVELGQIHEGIDPAEVPLKDFPFALGDKVTLSKAFEMPIWGGGTTELAKGTKGVIKNLYDGHGDAFMVTTEDGQTYCIPTDCLK